jgi:hypothetical protein
MCVPCLFFGDGFVCVCVWQLHYEGVLFRDISKLFDLMKDNENITIAGFLAAVEAAK